jgi:hypothetical protein
MRRLLVLATLASAAMLLPGCTTEFDPRPTRPATDSASPALLLSEGKVHTIPLILKPGQSGRVGLLKVTFLRVLADSRCPSDVVCVWQGNAAVQLSVIRLGQLRTARRVVLHTTLEPHELAFREYRLVMGELQPYPMSTNPIKLRAYQLTLQVDFVGLK